MSKEQIKFIRDLAHDLMLLVKSPKPEPSLLARSIQFTNQVGWIDRLVAYGQLEDWLSHKHTTTEENHIQ